MKRLRVSFRRFHPPFRYLWSVAQVEPRVLIGLIVYGCLSLGSFLFFAYLVGMSVPNPISFIFALLFLMLPISLFLPLWIAVPMILPRLWTRFVTVTPLGLDIHLVHPVERRKYAAVDPAFIRGRAVWVVRPELWGISRHDMPEEIPFPNRRRNLVISDVDIYTTAEKNWLSAESHPAQTNMAKLVNYMALFGIIGTALFFALAIIQQPQGG